MDYRVNRSMYETMEPSFVRTSYQLQQSFYDNIIKYSNERNKQKGAYK